MAVHSWPLPGRLGVQLQPLPLLPAPQQVPADPRVAETGGSGAPPACAGGPDPDAGRTHRGPPGSLAALSHVLEELLALLVAEAPQAVGALQVPLASLGHSRAPALCGEVQPLGSRPRPPATSCHRLRSVGL